MGEKRFSRESIRLARLRPGRHVPRGRREKLRDLERVVAELEQKHGTPPSPEEIAEVLGVPLDEVDDIMHSARVAGCVSLEDGPTNELAQMLSDPKSQDPVGSAEWREMRSLLIKAISRLPEQEKTVITMYYGEELLLKEIGVILGVTESRVSQIHSRALYRLNRELVTVGGKL